MLANVILKFFVKSGGVIVICNNCGGEYDYGEELCPYCGVSLKANNEDYKEINKDYSAKEETKSVIVTGDSLKYTPNLYKGFWSVPRIVEFLAAILTVISCVLPIFTTSDGKEFSFILSKYGAVVLLLPVLIFLNAFYDKSEVKISIPVVQFKFLKFKLCILWGISGIASLFCAVIICGVETYTPIFYFGIIGYIIAILVPFLVKKDDGTGIKPVVSYDFVWISVAVVVALSVCGKTYYDNLSENSLSNSENSYSQMSLGETDKAAASSTPEVSETPKAAQTPKASEPPADNLNNSNSYSQSSQSDSIDDGSLYQIQDLLSELYSFGWVMATNNQNASYVEDYTAYGSPAYQTFGVDYWQERPSVRFDYINDVNVIDVQKKSDGSYDAYVYYTYKIYHTDKDKISSNIELAIDNVVYDGYGYLVYEHTWIDDIPLGSTVTIENYRK